MARTTIHRNQRITEMTRQLSSLQAELERSRRVLEGLYNISLACRGITSFRQIFEAIYRELEQIFPLDACYIALCDAKQEGMFQAVYMVDEGLTDYQEQVRFGALTGLLVNGREPLLFHDLQAEHSPIGTQADPFGQEEKASRSWLGMPLLVGQSMIGIISVQSYQPFRFTEMDVDLLQQMGNTAAVALENATLSYQQHALSAALSGQVAARTVELATLNALAAELVLQKPLPTLLNHALELIVPLFGLEGGTVRLIDRHYQTLTLLAHLGFTPEYVEATRDVPIDSTAQGRVVRENQPQTVSGDLSAFVAPKELRPDYQSLLSVPLRSGERVLGTLNLVGLRARTFAEQEIDLAQAIANQIAIATENARLFAAQQRQINELQALSSISHAASTTLELTTLLRLVHNALRSFMPLDAFMMVVYDPERRIITDGISIDEGQEYTYWSNQPPPPGSLTGWMIQNRRMLHLRNLQEEYEQYVDSALQPIGSGKHAHSWLGAPLENRDGAVIGAISLQGYQANVFDERDELFLRNMAGQVALHVQNMQLTRQRERQIKELDAIGQIGKLISASFDFEEMLQGVYTTLHDLTDSSVFYLIICEPDTHTVTNAIFFEVGERIPITWTGTPPPAGSLTGWIIDQREPLLIHYKARQTDELLARGIEPQPLGPENEVQSWVGVPLLARDRDPIGVLSLQDYQPYKYDDQTIDVLTQVASHISLGVQKVRLFEERQRQVEENARLYAAEQAARRTADTLREVARVLSSSFDSREVLRLILRELHNVIAYDSASIMLLERDTLRIAASRGLQEDQIEKIARLHLNQRTAAWEVVMSQQPKLIADTRLRMNWQPEPATAHVISWLGVPLLSRGTILGVLNIDSWQPDVFTERDVEVAQAFANQAAVALENARLYEESVTRVEQELEIARRIQSNLFPHGLPQMPGIELDARCLPARETGGDFYDFVELTETESEPQIGLIVGDASGKSIPAAMLMAIARSIVRSEARDHHTAQTVVCETNSLIAQDVPRQAFVALSYATLNVPQRRLALANAGQLAPLRLKADGTLEYLQPPGPALPLGILPDIPYEALEITLDPGDLLVFFTDGIVEAKNQALELFGFERLEALLHEHGHLPPHRLIDRVLEAIAHFMGPMPQHDDMTMLAVRVKG